MGIVVRRLSSNRHAAYLGSILAVASILILANFSGFADATAVHRNSQATQGEVLFHKNCITCHNKQVGDTSPFGPPNLHGIFSKKPLVTPPITPTEAMAIIHHGKGVMPPFGHVLSDSEIADLIAYLKTQ